MNVAQIRSIARKTGVRPLPRNKLALVRAIQTGEGNFPCFGTALDAVCDQQSCLWRGDCFKVAKGHAG